MENGSSWFPNIQNNITINVPDSFLEIFIKSYRKYAEGREEGGMRHKRAIDVNSNVTSN